MGAVRSTPTETYWIGGVESNSYSGDTFLLFTNHSMTGNCWRRTVAIKRKHFIWIQSDCCEIAEWICISLIFRKKLFFFRQIKFTHIVQVSRVGKVRSYYVRWCRWTTEQQAAEKWFGCRAPRELLVLVWTTRGLGKSFSNPSARVVSIQRALHRMNWAMCVFKQTRFKKKMKFGILNFLLPTEVKNRIRNDVVGKAKSIDFQ